MAGSSPDSADIERQGHHCCEGGQHWDLHQDQAELQLGEAGALQDWRVNTLEGGGAHQGGYTDREEENHFRAQDGLGSQLWAHSSLVLRVPVESEEPVSLSDEKTRDEVVPVVVFCLLLAGSLWHKGRWLPCTERSYYRRPYAIKNQQGATHSDRQHFYLNRSYSV